jgi:hypothetical protein
MPRPSRSTRASRVGAVEPVSDGVSKRAAAQAGTGANVSHDAVNHPQHYTSHPSGVECITVVEHMSFNLGNAVKYIWRAGDKGPVDEDLRKAIWYIERERQRLAKEQG